MNCSKFNCPGTSSPMMFIICTWLNFILREWLANIRGAKPYCQKTFQKWCDLGWAERDPNYTTSVDYLYIYIYIYVIIIALPLDLHILHCITTTWHAPNRYPFGVKPTMRWATVNVRPADHADIIILKPCSYSCCPGYRSVTNTTNTTNIIVNKHHS